MNPLVESMPGGGIGHLRLYVGCLLVGTEIVQSVGCWWRLLGQGRSILVDWLKGSSAGGWRRGSWSFEWAASISAIGCRGNEEKTTM